MADHNKQKEKTQKFLLLDINIGYVCPESMTYESIIHGNKNTLTYASLEPVAARRKDPANSVVTQSSTRVKMSLPSPASILIIRAICPWLLRLPLPETIRQTDQLARFELKHLKR